MVPASDWPLVARQRRKAGGQLRGVREPEPGVVSITSPPPPHGLLARSWRRLVRLVLGPPLPTEQEAQEQLGPFTGLAVLGADLVASSVYGPEEMLRILALAGAGALALSLPLSVAIVLLLAIVATSYQQTIRAYPSGAGGYIVASDNLGMVLGLVAAAALLVDYALDVAVSVSTGVQSFTSVLPALAPWRVWLALVALALLTLTNLRGIRTTGVLFAAPIYLYLAATLAMVATGVVRWAGGTLPPYNPPPEAGGGPVEALGLFLLLRAFSSGAVALTGIEAVSNGVPYFRPPQARNACTTLLLMAGLFGAAFLGLGFLAAQLRVVPDPSEVETVVSQLTRTLFGRGFFYFMIQVSSVLLLILAANTGFADFPRLLSLLARDRYLPELFALRGSRLSFSNGILLVSILSGLLIVVFQASLARLIPLFTVGAFATFTLSQAGMALHWWRRRAPGWHWRMAINAAGAATTAIVLLVVAISKFVHGAWVVVLVVPLLVLLLLVVHWHYRRAAAAIRLDPRFPEMQPGVLAQELRHHIVIPVAQADRVVFHAIAYLRSLVRAGAGSGAAEPAPVTILIEAVHVTDDKLKARRLRAQWRQLDPGIPLVILESPYRDFAGAVLRYLDVIEHRTPQPAVITIAIPELVAARWWERLLHNAMAVRLKAALRARPRTAVLTVPFHLRR
jgi:amino acid transporter